MAAVSVLLLTHRIDQGILVNATIRLFRPGLQSHRSKRIVVGLALLALLVATHQQQNSHNNAGRQKHRRHRTDNDVNQGLALQQCRIVTRSLDRLLFGRPGSCRRSRRRCWTLASRCITYRPRQAIAAEAFHIAHTWTAQIVRADR